MANPEHLAILSKGVETWNEWREQNRQVRPDLSGMNLSGAHLGHVNLSRAHLMQTWFVGTDLIEANLSQAHLHQANLTGACLIRARFSNAILTGADLGAASLSEANLSQAHLNRANLRGAHLGGTCISRAHLEDTDLRYSQLGQCDLTRASITGAKLYSIGRDDWIINGVECSHVFWDTEGEIRSPQDRDFAPGEFEQLYRALPSIEYVFQNGMTPLDPLIMDRVVQAIREQNPDYDLKIDSITARGLAPSMRFTVLLEEYKDAALMQIRSLHEVKLRQVEEERDRYWAAITRALDTPTEVKLIAAAPGAIVATDGSTIQIQQHIHHAVELQRVIVEQPEDSPTFAKVAKKTALDILGSALEDVAKGQVKKAAEQIIELGKDLGPVIVNTAAYGFFRSFLGL